MASNAIVGCNSSSSHAVRRYEVFVSFRGEDTRNNFTGSLLHALRRNGIEVFQDDANLKKGESIAPELLQAIEASHVFIVVFSTHYASSTWCLRELERICNCIETSHRCVLPVFYDVDPSEVRKQSGYFEEAFAKHEEMFQEDKEKMEELKRWRKSLTQVASLSGWDILNKPQHEVIEEIVQNVINLLGPKFSSLPNDNLVGMESRVEELEKLLRLDSINDTRVVGITGMSGIGKTTLGRALYERISHQYDFHCFIDDVSKTYRDSGSLGVQKKLLSHSLNDKNVEICNVSMGTCLVWTRLRNVRAFIVLDNVDQAEQLKIFTGNRDTLLKGCLGGGSSIIIISRDNHILRTHGVDDVYHVRPLNEEHAVRLFCRNAFKGNYIMSDYEKLTHEVLRHARGHPLAIEVLGSSLFGRDVSQWISALGRLRENTSKKIMDVLRISFDELDDMDKEIFLDIACLFHWNQNEQYWKEILDFRGFHPDIGLQVLNDKSLISIKNGSIYMHDLLRNLGKCIVREKFPKEPRKWSRLWNYKDIHKVILENMAAENLEAIVIEYLGDIPEITMRADAISKMGHLQLLQLHNLNFSGSLNFLSNELGYLIWEKYPFECLPSCFQPDKLVELSLRHSNIKRLWEGSKIEAGSSVIINIPPVIGPSLQPLHNLRRLYLSQSQHLIDMPNFGEAPNLESICLEGCIQLRQIDPSIGLLRKLTCLNLRDCKSLIKLPPFGEGLNLETLNLKGCLQLRQIDPSIGLLRKLTVLNLEDCKNLVSLPNSIFNLNSLECLSLDGCSKLYNIQLLDEARDSEHLKKLCEVPFASHSAWSIMKSWFTLPLHLFYSKSSKDSVSLLLPPSLAFSCMRELHLSFCNLLQVPDAIGNLHLLERLYLRGNNFSSLPSLKELSKLIDLDLQHCKRLKSLPELPSKTDMSSPCYRPPMSVKEFYGLGMFKAGLEIFNCPELVDKEHCSRMCFSWMMQIVQADHRYKCGEHCSLLWPPHISSIIPGSEIPRWFNNQYEGKGNFIYIDTSHFIQDSDWIGFACTIIFVIRKQRERKTQEKEGIRSMFMPLLYCGDLVTDESDHMLLLYFNRPHFISVCQFLGDDMAKMTYPSDLKLKFKIYENECCHVEVKKYGYRLLYEEDLQLSNLAMKQSENSLSRKRKFVTIDEQNN